MGDPYAEVEEHARERVRLAMASERISSARIMDRPTSDEDEVRGAGYASLNEYFAAELARPRTVARFTYFLKLFHLEPTCSPKPALDAAIRAILKRAVLSKQPFIYADPQASFEQQYLKDPLAAAVWIASMPSERGLLSPALLGFLQAPSLADPSATPAEYGKKAATKLLAVITALLEIYPSGPPAANRGAIKEAVEAKIGREVSPRTLDRARQKAWPIIETLPNVAKSVGKDVAKPEAPPAAPPVNCKPDDGTARRGDVSKTTLARYLNKTATKQLKKPELFELAKAHFPDSRIRTRTFEAAYT